VAVRLSTSFVKDLAFFVHMGNAGRGIKKAQSGTDVPPVEFQIRPAKKFFASKRNGTGKMPVPLRRAGVIKTIQVPQGRKKGSAVPAGLGISRNRTRH
jgi:hypothetical protein